MYNCGLACALRNENDVDDDNIQTMFRMNKDGKRKRKSFFLRSSCCDSLQWTNASIKILKVHVWLAFLWGAPLYRLFFSLVLVVMYAKFYALSTNKKAHRIALLCELTLNNQHKMCVEFFVHLPINTAIVQKENCYVGAHGIHHEP